MLHTLLSILGIAGFTGVTMAFVLNKFLEKSIEKVIGHRYDKLLDTHKTENVLLSKRFDTSIQACQELHGLVAEINADLESLVPKEGLPLLDTLLTEFHPKYRRRFQIIRAKFEATNDIFSSYSLQFDNLTHRDFILEMSQLLKHPTSGNIKPSDLRRMYRKIWTTTSDSLTCLVRVCSDAKFWEPNSNYAARADHWAVHDVGRVKNFLKDCLSLKGDKTPTIFYLSIEEDGGAKRFWSGYAMH